MAHDIVETKLLDDLNGKNSNQLLMCIMGEGGMGKLAIIQTIAKMYEEHRVQNWLAKMATSGVAATLIEGETLHSWLSIGPITGDDWKIHSTPTVDTKHEQKIAP